jgi:hypothetical protein
MLLLGLRHAGVEARGKRELHDLVQLYFETLDAAT